MGSPRRFFFNRKIRTMVHPASFFVVLTIDASDCGALARDSDAIVAPTPESREVGEGTATDLHDGGKDQSATFGTGNANDDVTLGLVAF